MLRRLIDKDKSTPSKMNLSALSNNLNSSLISDIILKSGEWTREEN